jgi:serine/threonine protein kinase
MDPSVDSFLKTVLRSGVLDADQLKAGYRAVAKEQRHDPRAVAEHLIKTGKLSRFQANKLLAGTGKGLVLGPYQVLAPIGKGGMATVYLARDSRSGQLVALKVLPPRNHPRQERLLARFRREMDLCRRVAHQHIARTFEVGVELGIYYIAMEFIPGNDLSTLVRNGGALPVPRAARLFAEVASALQHAHAQGLVHRDLKPSNIRVTTSDRAKILDLGLALLEGEQAIDREVSGGLGYVVGSMDFIAPEQTLDSCGVDGRADVYSMGCSLYFALSGQPPFPGGTALEKILRHRNAAPVPLLKLNPTVPPRFAELVHRMMAKDPNARVASADQARHELLGWAPAAAPPFPEAAEDASFRRAVASLQAKDADDDLEAIPVAEPLQLTPGTTLLWVVGGAIVVVLLMAMAVGAILLVR